MPSVKIVNYLPDGSIKTVTKECRHIVATRVKADSYAALKCGMRVGYEVEVIGTDLGDETFHVPGDADALFYFNAAGVMADAYRIEKDKSGAPSTTPIRRFDAAPGPYVAPAILPVFEVVPSTPSTQSSSEPQAQTQPQAQPQENR